MIYFSRAQKQRLGASVEILRESLEKRIGQPLTKRDLVMLHLVKKSLAELPEKAKRDGDGGFMTKLWEAISGYKTIIGIVLSCLITGAAALGYIDQKTAELLLAAAGTILGIGLVHKGYKAGYRAGERDAQ